MKTRWGRGAGDGDIPADCVAGAWLGPWGSDFIFYSDHRPILSRLHRELWLGAMASEETNHAPAETAEPPFPPRYWFQASDRDVQQATEDKRLNRLPRKLPRTALTDAFEEVSVQHAVGDLLAHARNGAVGDVLWQAYVAVGESLKAVLRPKIRERTCMGGPGDGHHPWGYAKQRLRGLRQWLRQVRRHGPWVFYQGSEHLQSDKFREIPEELWDIWHDAETLITTQRDMAPEALWRTAVDLAQDGHAPPRIRELRPPPKDIGQYKRYD